MIFIFFALQVKPEPDMVEGGQSTFESDEEELSEAEELRRNAAAYAAVAKRPAQEVIVLDDSSDEEARRHRKRPAAHVSAGEDAMGVDTARKRPLHQQASLLKVPDR